MSGSTRDELERVYQAVLGQSILGHRTDAELADDLIAEFGDLMDAERRALDKARAELSGTQDDARRLRL